MVTVSVPGKIHLMGEHAVVYGYPAILSAINLRLRVSISEDLEGEGVRVLSHDLTSHAQYAADFMLKSLHIASPVPSKISIESDIPSGYHLGSSAAMAVGVTGAMMYFYKKIWNPIKINELAYEIEKQQHGNPSGGDNTTVTMGGFIWYRKELEFLKSIWQLPFKPHASLRHFFLINTGKPKESTKVMVEHVSALVSKDPSTYEHIFHENEIQVRRMTAALKNGSKDEVIHAMQKGECTLEQMGVVSEFVRPSIREIEKNGGAVKILGGGGVKKQVGFMLCYHEDPQLVEALIRPYNFSLQKISLGEEGVRLDEK